MAMMFQTLARVMRSPADTLKVQCGACGHRVALERSAAFAGFGPDSTPPDVRRRAKCSACGRVGEARVWV